MGKRKKSSRGPQKKQVSLTINADQNAYAERLHVQKQVLPTNFSCLFCNHEKSVSVKLDKKAGIGELACKICGQQFQTGINYLSAPVDVYSDWIDACDAVAKEAVTNNEGDDGLNTYEDLAIDNERRNLETNVGQPTAAELRNGQYEQEEVIDDD